MTGSFAVGWRQVAVAFMLLAVTGMVTTTYSIVAVPLAREFQPSRMVLMLAMTVMSGVSAVLLPVVGNLMDRVSVRKLMVVGGAMLAAGFLAISLAKSISHVLIIYGVLMAPGTVLIGPVASTVLLSRWFVAKRGRAIGFAIAGISVGSFVFPIIIQGLLEAFSWREALRYLAVIVAVWTVPAAFLAIDHPHERGLNPDGATEAVELARREAAAPPISAREILTDPAFWLISGTVCIVTAGLKGTLTNLAPLAIDVGIAPRDAAFLVSIYAACGFVAKLNFAALADRLGPRILMFASLGGFALAMGVLTQARFGYSVIALGVSLAGLFGGLMVPTESYLAARVFGQHAVGRALGLMAGTILVGMLLTPPLFGLIFDLTGSYTGIFWTFCGLALLALLWVPTMRLQPREPASSQPEPVAAT